MASSSSNVFALQSRLRSLGRGFANAMPETQNKDAVALLEALLNTVETKISAIASAGIYSGKTVSGAAILWKVSMFPFTVTTNINLHEAPLLHCEIKCIMNFYAQEEFCDATGTIEAPASWRPRPHECVFLVTHEPCSLCLAAIAWTGFDTILYMFPYEESHNGPSVAHGNQILREVFTVPPDSFLPQRDRDARPLYNRRNKYFTARGCDDLVQEITETLGPAEGKKWADEVNRVKNRYNEMNDPCHNGDKPVHVQGGSFWK